MSLCASVYMCFVVTCWERADLLALVCGVYYEFVTFPFGILGQVWYLIVSIPDLCTLTYFKKNEFKVAQYIRIMNIGKMPNLTIFLFFDNNHSLTKYNVFLTKYLTKIVGIHILIAVTCNSFTASSDFCQESPTDHLFKHY